MEGSSWQRYAVYGLTLSSDYAFATHLHITTQAPDLTFTCLPTPPGALEPAIRPIYTSPFSDRDGESVGQYYRFADGDLIRIPHCADYYLRPDGITCHLLDPPHEIMVEINLL